MWIDITHRAPDEGESVVVDAIDHDGNIDQLGRTTREALRSAAPLLRAAMAHADEHGHESGEEVEHWRDLLHFIEQIPEMPSGARSRSLLSDEALDAAAACIRELPQDATLRHLDHRDLADAMLRAALAVASRTGSQP
jgi:hypothetical protein